MKIPCRGGLPRPPKVTIFATRSQLNLALNHLYYRLRDGCYACVPMPADDLPSDADGSLWYALRDGHSKIHPASLGHEKSPVGAGLCACPMFPVLKRLTKKSVYGRAATPARCIEQTKNSPAGPSHQAALSNQNKKLLGDELGPRLRFSNTEIPLNQFLRLSTAYFVQDLL